MKLTEAQRRVVRAILDHPDDDFGALMRLAGLDPAASFREADLRGVDFGTGDIADFDFSGADLRGANLARARGADRAIFTDALRDGATRGLPASPPPDFDMDRVREMILKGQAPPASWAPFIINLDFSWSSLSDVTPLAALTALQTLDLSGTQVIDVTPLAALTALQTLNQIGRASCRERV